jgi:hypothetical protein
VLIRAAAIQAAMGDVPEALTTAASINDARYRVVALEQVALAQANAGATEAARATLAEAGRTNQYIDYEYARAYGFSRIAGTQAKIGAIADALATVKKIDDAGLRARALWAVSTSQARAGDSAAALETEALARTATDDVEDTLEHAWLLSDAALERFQAGHRRDAQAIFADALAYTQTLTTPWLRARALSRLATTLVELQRDLTQTTGAGLPSR